VDCALYGDCCSDFAAACPVEANPPPGNGCTLETCNTDQAVSDANGWCFCDAACAQYGDCCANKTEVCGA
jgi:hypothetical protein